MMCRGRLRIFEKSGSGLDCGSIALCGGRYCGDKDGKNAGVWHQGITDGDKWGARAGLFGIWGKINWLFVRKWSLGLRLFGSRRLFDRQGRRFT